MKLKDLTGKSFGKWTVLFRGKNKAGHILWTCKCECGNIGDVYSVHLKSGASKGCKDCGTGKHGLTKSPEYKSWGAMRLRCFNKNHAHYSRYGGRGIGICERWEDFSFFLADMGKRPPGCSLGRIDNDKGYSPENCRWETSKEQNNNRKNNILINYKGNNFTLKELSLFLKINYNTLFSRFQKGSRLDSALYEK